MLSVDMTCFKLISIVQIWKEVMTSVEGSFGDGWIFITENKGINIYKKMYKEDSNLNLHTKTKP